ncbi:DMT family transporter [Microbacterium azadirachtae]|jgi:small multidrug resistance pump|uniref:Multidrug transporter EmrE n=1 Tax=Microbacterium azadirachtae TaxID=582680 RepID=A0A0F0KKS6_9MICO|nr:multidrug efflux SMR transporter [Microbacterium azadirachtae]KJL20735.1 Multidrug transporter EmrE [Microbacterium azadirachtae]UXW86902.1 multidrug efflux SMR transporter [Microbacterium azadirachtae]SDM31127.1 small multidrug resistance pump [Microbacterium azadirachtae]SEG46793.1 small multidrug resistance pump [Microbacterium azadirachtae]SEG52793.1 small multidrug resistance pump [Microbacterium azadirachtae]
MTVLLLLGAIAAEVTATLSLRASEGFRRRRHIPAIVIGYLVSYVLLGATLALGMPVGIAYAVWAALGVAATAVLGRVLFHDRISVMTAIGLAVIVGGVILVEAGSH